MPDTKPIASLILDLSIYPRHTVSDSHTAEIMEAIRAGVPMPPVLIDEKTSKVVDGFHRIEAYRRIHDETHQIAVTTKRYTSRKAMLTDAIALNIGRGQDLSRWDQVRCAVLAEEVGMPLDTLAKLLHWRPERLAAYRDSRMGTTLDDRKVALKRSLRHRMGKPLTEAQEAANEHLSGMPPMFHVNQLVTLFETDLMPDGDTTLVARVVRLVDLAGAWVIAQQPPEQKGA